MALGLASGDLDGASNLIAVCPDPLYNDASYYENPGAMCSGQIFKPVKRLSDGTFRVTQNCHER